jgi:hypothetical protein
MPHFGVMHQNLDSWIELIILRMKYDAMITTILEQLFECILIQQGNSFIVGKW